jgi:hypothetical protein
MDASLAGNGGHVTTIIREWRSCDQDEQGYMFYRQGDDYPQTWQTGNEGHVTTDGRQICVTNRRDGFT